MYKILSIDGGGIKGVFPASFLATIEEAVGGNIGQYFDLIVGTSTGGIIALGLASGMSSKDVLRFYEESGPEIFKGNRVLRFVRQIGVAKYSQKPLKDALTACFGDKLLGECKTRVVIPSLNLETGEVYVYKTAHHDRFKRDFKERLVDVALATSAAPTYFPTMRSAAGTPLVDGGLWANNPVGTAVVEAIGVLGWKQGEFEVLSIGCTTDPLSIKWGRVLPLGMGYWAKKSVEAFMKAQSSQSLGTAQLLGGHGHIYRYDPVLPHKRFSLDGTNEITSLKGLGSSKAREALPTLERVFFESEAAPFQPCHHLAV
ncbi:CBASS cGAMP-activated phospholipase [Paenibacillus sp. Y412MC10]|uniref:CBASS cGAMP-activated phospholipase n=1 Tax=Geobacillus sp. (strain Y412MC10) TaxID=481743 RepID=UPI0011AB7F61|nr:CBASS cGAMP-activated phospholipase [Paenibacillus sp. Y412MC10]